MQNPSFARRALAYLADLAVIYAIAVVTLITCVALYGQVKYGGDPRLMKALAAAPSTRLFTFWAHAAIFVSYFTIAQWYSGRTVGKFLCGLSVTGLNGEGLSFGQSAGRALGYIVSGQLTLGLGFMLPFFRRDGRALHDLLARTRVNRVASAANVIALPGPAESPAPHREAA